MAMMIRPKGKAMQIASAVLKKQGVKLAKPKKNEKIKLSGPYLQH